MDAVRRTRWAVQLSKRMAVLWQFPWPLSGRDIEAGEMREKQQGDLALRWRRAYEARRKREAA